MSVLNCVPEQLMTLIGAAKEHGIEFIYAISPGLDITFSNQKEVSALKRKLDQVLLHFSIYSLPWTIVRLFTLISQSIWFCNNVVFNSLGFSLWLQVLRLTFRRYWPQHVPCWQRGFQLICTRSGVHYQWNLPVPRRARNLPLLSHRYLALHQNHWHIWRGCFSQLCNHYLFDFLQNPEYCGTFCYPNVPQSPYLHTVGEKLLPGIDVLWTGEFLAF